MSLNDFISGSAAGIVQVLLGQPFDIVKVRLQTQGDLYKTPLNCFKSILKNEGPSAFYKGTLSPLLGISFCVAVQFGSNEAAKNYFKKKNKILNCNENLNLMQIIISGIFAGITNSIVISPVELLRIKLQVQGKFELGSSTNSVRYSGTIDCAKKIFSLNGMKGIYQGYSATLAREIPAYAVYFGTYESLMGMSEKQYGDRKKIPIKNIILYGAFSGLMLWISTFPLDVVKSCMQSDNIQNRKYPTIISTTTTIFREKGIGGFFKGLTPCLLRAPPINAATFFTFELVKGIMNKN
jgi:solute carrier family 25 carnitine/acylcarnitine transporter 20/29